MAVVAFYTNGKDQTGNTVSAISLATYMGIVQNKRTLFISTSFNNNEIKRALWPVQTKKSQDYLDQIQILLQLMTMELRG